MSWSSPFSRAFVFLRHFWASRRGGGFWGAPWRILRGVKSETSCFSALLIEADPALAESLKRTFGDEADVVHAAVVAESKQGPVTLRPIDRA